uniref:BTB/POZ domain-containing protein At3g22104-like n=1 Tax=Rhizophora mucronata TaxID=61149 RepID=A0A2P2JAQ3_RHIMU
MMTWPISCVTMDCMNISIKFVLRTNKSSNHQADGGMLLFKLSVLRVSFENRNPELSGEEVDGHGLDSLDKEILPMRESIHFSRIPEQFAKGSKFWHCLIAANSSAHVQ